MLQVWKFHGIFCSRNIACAFGGIMPSYYGMVLVLELLTLLAKQVCEDNPNPV